MHFPAVGLLRVMLNLGGVALALREEIDGVRLAVDLNTMIGDGVDLLEDGLRRIWPAVVVAEGALLGAIVAEVDGDLLDHFNHVGI